MQDESLDRTWWALRLTYGLVPIIAGLDKFTNLLVDWTQYLSPLALRVVPVSASTFMMIVGVIEIVAGVIVLAKPRIGAYIVGAWLVAIAINLVTMGTYFDIAVRDLVMSVGAFTLARLSAIRSEVTVREDTRVRTPAAEPHHVPA